MLFLHESQTTYGNWLPNFQNKIFILYHYTMLHIWLFDFKKNPKKGIEKLNRKHGGKILNGLFVGSLVDQTLYCPSKLPDSEGVDVSTSQPWLWSSHDPQRCQREDYTHELTNRELYTVDIPGLEDRDINDLTPGNIIDSKNTEIMQTLRCATINELQDQGLVSIQSYEDISRILRWEVDISTYIHEIQRKVFMITPKWNGLIFPLPKQENNTPAVSWSTGSVPSIWNIAIWKKA
jgi:hypothetical protein